VAREDRGGIDDVGPRLPCCARILLRKKVEDPVKVRKRAIREADEGHAGLD
jgi:hypothetical protein